MVEDSLVGGMERIRQRAILVAVEPLGSERRLDLVRLPDVAHVRRPVQLRSLDRWRFLLAARPGLRLEASIARATGAPDRDRPDASARCG